MKSAEEQKAFVQGYVCAVATILREHGAHVQARDALNGIGKVNRSDIDDFDLEMLDKYQLTQIFEPPPRQAKACTTNREGR